MQQWQRRPVIIGACVRRIHRIHRIRHRDVRIGGSGGADGLFGFGAPCFRDARLESWLRRIADDLLL